MILGQNRLVWMIGAVSILVFCQISISDDIISKDERIIARGDSLRRIGQYTLALESYHAAIPLFLSEKNLSGEADALRGIGTVYYYQGNCDSALEYWQKAYQIYHDIGDKKGEGKILNNYGQVNSDRSNFNQAIKHFNQSLTIALELGNRKEEGIASQNLGNVYLKRAEYPKALANYQHSLKVFREIGNRQYEMITLITIGSVYLYLYDYAKAAEYYQKSYLTAKELGDCMTEAEAMNNLGIVYQHLHEYDKALNCHQQSLALCQELSNRNAEGNALNNIGVVYSELENYLNALDYYRRSLLVYRDFGNRLGECSNLLNIGRIYSKMGKYQEGLDSIRKGLDIAENIGSGNYIQAGYQGLGDCYLAQGLSSQARANYAKAIITMEEIRGKLRVEAQKTSYASGVFKVYEKMVTLLLADNQIVEAFNYVERGRARSFLDILGGEVQVDESTQVEILHADRDGLRHEPELKSMSSQQPLTLQEVQRLLDPESTLLDYFLTENEILFWVVTRENIKVIKIDMTSDSLQSLVESFRETIQWKGSTDYLSSELYKILIKPALDEIGTKKLVIVPHGILHYLPFHALKGQDGKYLFEQYQISYVPSASVMKYLPQKRREMGNRVLALGNPAIDHEEYSSIEFSEAEVERIGKVFPHSEIYIGNLASESMFRERAQEYDILHLACHTDLNSLYPLFSGLLLAPGGENDGKLDVYEIFSLDLHASLVVLSSCQTGLGHLTTGDELVGLSRAFFCAGTQSLVSSLWEVNDESTGYLMECFYRNMRNHSKVESLQMAQFDTKNKYGDLYYWAPFVLIGRTN